MLRARGARLFRAASATLLASTIVSAGANQAPRVLAFDAAVVRVQQEIPLVGSVDAYVPVATARLADTDGVETIASVTFTSIDGSQTILPGNDDGTYSAVLPPLAQFDGGTISVIAVDAEGAESKVDSDEVGPVTLDPPVLTLPASGETDIELTPRLEWEEAAGAKGYVVHVSTESPVNEADPSDWQTGLLEFFAEENTAVDFRDEVAPVSERRIPKGRLLPGTRYWWAIGSIDALGDVDQIAVSGAFEFQTRAGVASIDTLPPTFTSNPEVERVTKSSITVSWKTDEPADTRAYYTANPQVRLDSVFDGRLSRQHRIDITDLKRGTEYHLSLASTDASGNTLRAAFPRTASTLTSEDLTPPEFTASPSALQVREDRVTMKWVADELVTATVTLTTAGHDTAVIVDVADRNFQVTIAGLSPGTRYDVAVSIVDVAGNGPVEYTGAAFTTRGGADRTPPRALKSAVVIPSEFGGVVYWTADEYHTAVVEILAGPSGSLVTQVFADVPNVEQLARFTGLNPGTHYKARVTLRDLAGNEWRSPPAPFRTLAAEDLTAPSLIRLPVPEYVSDTRVVLVWVTDEPADSYVRYLVNGQFAGEASRGALIRKHRVVLTKLVPGNTYEFEIESADAAGNIVHWPGDDPVGRPTRTAQRGTSTFTTAVVEDNTFPVITSAPRVVGRTATTISIDWGTDETANSVVYYADGTSTKMARGTAVEGYNNTVTSTDYVASHVVTISGLEPGTVYPLVVSSTDPAGNGEVTSVDDSTVTLGLEDIDPPVITQAPEVIGATDDRVTVRWYTNEAANGIVAYRVAGTADEWAHVADPDLSTEHVITLTNLTPATSYELQVESTDLIGNGPATSNVIGATNATADVAEPILSNVSVIVDAEQAIVRWSTDEPSDSWIEIGTTASYGLEVTQASFNTSHEVRLANLVPGTPYYYRVASADASGNIGITPDDGRTFTTLLVPDTTPPMRVTGVQAGVGAYAVRLSWPAPPDANEIAGYFVERATNSGEFIQVAGPLLAGTYTDHSVSMGSEYQYRIRSKDLSVAGNMSSPGDTTIVTPTASDSPSAPTTLTPAHTSGVLAPLLTVSNATANSRAIASYGFIVSADQAFTQVVVTGANIPEAADSTSWLVPFDLEQDRTYWWAARAVDTDGFAGPFSELATVTVDSSLKPTAVALNSFQATSHGRAVAVTWDVASGESLGFHVWRTDDGDTFERTTSDLLVGGPSFEFLDVGVMAGREYGYRIEALLPEGGTQTFGPVSAQAALPDRVELHQNVPNPFNPTTRLSYEIPEASRVRLFVYNSLGQRVASIVDAEQVAGYYHVVWDGRSNAGGEAASGIYFARLVVDARIGSAQRDVQTIRMLLIR